MRSFRYTYGDFMTYSIAPQLFSALPCINILSAETRHAVPVYSLQELALVSSYFTVVDFADELCVFVDEPRFT